MRSLKSSDWTCWRLAFDHHIFALDFRFARRVDCPVSGYGRRRQGTNIGRRDVPSRRFLNWRVGHVRQVWEWCSGISDFYDADENCPLGYRAGRGGPWKFVKTIAGCVFRWNSRRVTA
jgi:hypothetical protein